MSFVPLTEGCSINDNNSVLHQGLGTDQLVVGSVVDNVNDTGLPGNGFTTPGKVALVKTKGTVLFVSTTNTNSMDALGT